MSEQVDYSYKFGTRTPVVFSDPLTGRELAVRTNGMVFVTELTDYKSKEELKAEVVGFAEESVGNTFLALPSQFNCANLNAQRELFEETLRIGLAEQGITAHVHMAPFRFEEECEAAVRQYLKEHPEAVEAAAATAAASAGAGTSSTTGTAGAAGAVPAQGGARPERPDGKGKPGERPERPEGKDKPGEKPGEKPRTGFSITGRPSFCRECGRRLSENDKFCRNCGAKTD